MLVPLKTALVLPFSSGEERKTSAEESLHHFSFVFQERLWEGVKNRERPETAAKQEGRKVPVRAAPPGGCAGIRMSNINIYLWM